MAEHSPGPWHVVHEPTLSTFHIRVQDLDAAPVASLFYSSGGSRPQLSRELIDANARLIAAAPDMLEALHDVLRYCVTPSGLPDKNKGRTPEQDAAMAKAKAAIAKAEGNQ